MDLKNELRALVRRRKAETASGELERVSRRIMQRLERMPRFREAATVALYWSLPGEVETWDFVQKWSASKRILLPVMQDGTLVLRPFTGRGHLVQAGFGIWEPAPGKEVPLEEVDLVVVPGMGFDPRGGRLGRGRGFYDRLLTVSRPFKVGVCFDFQLFDEIPAEPHDVPMDAVVCGSPQKVTVYEKGEKRA